MIPRLRTLVAVVGFYVLALGTVFALASAYVHAVDEVATCDAGGDTPSSP